MPTMKQVEMVNKADQMYASVGATPNYTVRPSSADKKLLLLDIPEAGISITLEDGWEGELLRYLENRQAVAAERKRQGTEHVSKCAKLGLGPDGTLWVRYGAGTAVDDYFMNLNGWFKQDREPRDFDCLIPIWRSMALILVDLGYPESPLEEPSAK